MNDSCAVIENWESLALSRCSCPTMQCAIVFHVRLKKKCSIRVVALCLVSNNIHCSIRVRVINRHLAEHEGGFIGNELVIQQLCVVEIVLSLSMFINSYVMMY